MQCLTLFAAPVLAVPVALQRGGCARQRAGARALGHRILPALVRMCFTFLVPANWCATSSETPNKPPRSRSLVSRDGALFEYKGIVSV